MSCKEVVTSYSGFPVSSKELDSSLSGVLRIISNMPKNEIISTAMSILLSFSPMHKKESIAVNKGPILLDKAT